MILKRISAVLLLCCITTLAFPWGKNGHRIIAAICESYMSESAKEEMYDIMGPDFIEELSTWPDYVRSEPGWKFADPWHYTTVHMGQTPAEVRRKYNDDDDINDALEAIDLMADILRGDQGAIDWLESKMKKSGAQPLRGSTRATALAYLVHLVGDLHMPLHVGKNQDRGGNNITVLYFDERTNIHSLWDTGMIEHEQLSYTEFARFINKATDSDVSTWQDSTVDDWAGESIDLREDIYNNIYNYTDRETGLPSFSWKYQHDYIPHVKDRLLKAGVRLAGMLDKLLG